MDFQNVSPLNVRLNMVSGNLLPMTAGNTSFSIFWRAYGVLMWLVQIIVIIALIPGCMKVSQEKFLRDGIVSFVYAAEIFVIIIRFKTSKDLVKRLIRCMNDILSVADDVMGNIVTTTLQPVQIPLKLYSIVGVMSMIIWTNLPLLLLFEKDVFYYEDYRVPAAFFGQPLSPRTFLLGSIVPSIGCIYLFIKKVSLDMYMIHMVLIITAQYRYIATKMAMIFQKRDEDKHDESGKMYSSKWRERQIKVLCRHHNALIHMTSMLKKLLSLNFSLIYLNSVLRFCLMAVMMVMATSWERFTIVMYSSGALVQLYILCSCVQHLLDASTEVTDQAFHQKWYLFGLSIKRIFMLIIMANNLKCKVAMFKKFNLFLPSLMMILNQSYSIALLFLKMK